MQKRQIIIIGGIVLALLILAAGCGWVENLQVFKEGGGNAQDQQLAGDTDPAVIEQGVGLTQDSADTEGQVADSATDGTVQASADTKEIVLYFASSDGSSLEPETRQIPKQDGIARATVNELIAGPQDPSLNPTLPAGAILEDINIADGICTVDFSSDLLDTLTEDEQAQLLALYSIVNTLTQFDTVDCVQVLIDGKTLGTVGGVNASGALTSVNF